jgi:hypothetical protein
MEQEYTHEVGDSVEFYYRGQSVEGTVTKLSPNGTRAVVSFQLPNGHYKYMVSTVRDVGELVNITKGEKAQREYCMNVTGSLTSYYHELKDRLPGLTGAASIVAESILSDLNYILEHAEPPGNGQS